MSNPCVVLMYFLNHFKKAADEAAEEAKRIKYEATDGAIKATGKYFFGIIFFFSTI